MDRYHFHTEGSQHTTDREGTELPDDAAIRHQAITLLGELVRGDPEGFWAAANFRLTVTDARGLILYILDLTATTSPAAGPWRSAH